MTKFHKFFRSLLAIGSILWLGGVLAKTAVIYDLFKAGTLELKPEYTDAIRVHSAYLFSTISGYTITGYILTLLSAICLIPSARKEFKTKGYLMMCYILFVIFTPVEIYRQYLDVKLSIAFKSGAVQYGFGDTQIQDYLMAQFNQPFGAFVMLAFFSFFTCAILMAWRPLYKK